jgi:hypothetical protein
MAAELTDNQRAWVDALRSGKFKQGVGALKKFRDDVPTYCCLGVATELTGFAGEETEETGLVYFTRPGESEDDSGYVSFPFAEVREWLGDNNTGGMSGDIYLDVPDEIAKLPSPRGLVDAIFYNTGVSVLNDDGFTFDQIADCIEYFGVRDSQSSGWPR